MISMTKLGAAAVVAATLSVAFAPMASADPVPPTTPRGYVGVGSDTIQDVWNGLTNGYTKNGVRVYAKDTNVASWNAFGEAAMTITTRAGRPAFARPQGSGDGVNALSASLQRKDYKGTVLAPNDVNFARSSSGPDAAKYPGTQLTFVPFARDAVSVVINTGNRGIISVSTTKANLIKMYSATKAQYPTCKFPVYVRETNGVLGQYYVVPWLPQSNSGTRKFFLTATLGKGVNPGDCTVQSSRPENDGKAVPPGAIMPFSAAQWIMQRNNVIAKSVTTPLSANTTSIYEGIAAIDGQTAVTGYGSKLAPGTLFGDPAAKPASGTYARDTYTVMPTFAATTTNAFYNRVKADSQAMNGYVPVVNDFGFLKLSPAYIDSFTASSAAKQGYTL